MNPDEQAQKIAARVDAQAVGFDPITILTIIGGVISILVNCWRLQHPTADYALAALLDENSRRPKRLLKRVKRRVKKASTEDLSDDQAEAIAHAIIDEAVAEENTTSFLTAMRETPVMAVEPDTDLDDEDD